MCDGNNRETFLSAFPQGPRACDAPAASQRVLQGLILGERDAFDVRVLSNREKYGARPAIFRDHDRPISREFFYGLA